MTTPHRSAAVSLSVLITLATAVAGETLVGTTLRQRLPDRSVDLVADVGRVVVLGRDGRTPAAPPGLTVDTSAPSFPPGWVAWTVTNREVGIDVDSLAKRPEIAFATPILRCADGWWRVPTPDLIVSVGSEGSPEERLERIAIVIADLGLPPTTIAEVEPWGVSGTVRMRPHADDGITLLRLADTIADHPLVRFAEPDFILEGRPGRRAGDDGPPVSDPQFSDQWALDDSGQAIVCNAASTVVDIDVNAPEAWLLADGRPEVTVLVIDNGVQFDHPDLLADPSLGFDPTPGDGGGWPVDPCDNHGTAVAGVLAAIKDNEVGIAGLASGVRIASARISMPVLDCVIWSVQSSWVAAALAWGESIGATISNTSWSFAPSAIIAEAYSQRAAKGMLHFACSQNQGLPIVTFPASLPTVIAVGAVNRSGNLASFSNWGDAQEFVAPGVKIRTTDRTGSAGYGSGSYTCVDGTSFAAPLATGTAALMRSANPQLSSWKIREILRETATDLGTPGWDPIFGHGLVRADAAVALALGEVPSIAELADLDGNGVIDGADLGLMLAAWASGDPTADLNGDGVVDGGDLGLLLNLW